MLIVIHALLQYEMCIILCQAFQLKNDLAIESANSELVLCFPFRNTYSFFSKNMFRVKFDDSRWRDSAVYV